MSVSIPTTTGASTADLAQLADRLGEALPKQYVDFVQKHDGARPEPNTFETGPSGGSGVNYFVQVAEVCELKERIEGFPANGIPFAADACGNYAYVEVGSGAVFFWDHEIDDLPFKIADSVSSFIASLSPFDPSSVPVGKVISVWIDPDFKAEMDRLREQDEPN